MEEQICYENMIPDPPKDLGLWLQKHGRLNKQYLIYKAGRSYEPLEDRFVKAVEVACSACGQKWYEEKVEAAGCHCSYAPAPFGFYNDGKAVISGQDTVCPYCGAKVHVLHIRNMGLFNTEEVEYPLVISKVQGKLILHSYAVRRIVGPDATFATQVLQYQAYVVEEKKIVHLTGFEKFMTTLSFLGRWKQRKGYRDDFGKIGEGLVYPYSETVTDHTSVENAHFKKYMKEAGQKALPVTYLRCYLRHQNIENLIMNGFSVLISEAMWEDGNFANGYYGYGDSALKIPKLAWIEWKKDRPTEMLRIGKEELRKARADGWGLREFELWNWSKKNKAGLLQEEIAKDPLEAYMIANQHGTFDESRMAGKDLAFVVKYLRHQHHRDARADSSFLTDYWRTAAELGLDLEQPDIRFPYDLIKFHDRAADAIRLIDCRAPAEQDAIGDFKTLEKLLKPLNWKHGGLLIRVAKSQQDLTKEGAALHHCVGTYGRQHLRGESIFFIRHTDSPQKSYFTLNLDIGTGKVIQNRGDHNCARTPEVQAFENEWLEQVVTPYVKQTLRPLMRKAKKDRAAAAKKFLEKNRKEAQKMLAEIIPAAQKGAAAHGKKPKAPAAA